MVLAVKKMKMFDPVPTVWDKSRGRRIPTDQHWGPTDDKGLQKMVDQLEQSNWAETTRYSYNSWVNDYCNFTELRQEAPLPIRERTLCQFLVYLATYYAGSSLKQMSAALSSWCSFNGVPNPFQKESNSKVYRLKRALQRVARMGQRKKKCIIDETFIVEMCKAFLDDFEDVDIADLDPEGRGTAIVWLRAVGIILMGWEAGLRSNEVSMLTVCCWETQADGDKAVHVKLAKNNRLMKSSVNTVVGDKSPFRESFSLAAFMREYWKPFLRQLGLRHSRRCTHVESPQSLCNRCPYLFPSFGKAITKRGSKAISGSTVSDAVKKWARRIGRKHQDYSAVSFRRGSVSVARADGTISRDMARQHLRHTSEKSQDFYVERSRDARRAVGLAHRRAVERAAKKAVGRHVRFSV